MWTVKKMIRNLFENNSKTIQENEKTSSIKKESLEKQLSFNLEKIKKTLGNSPDIITREFLIGKSGNIKSAIIYNDGLANKELISDILDSFVLQTRDSKFNTNNINGISFINILKECVLTSCGVEDVYDFEALYSSVLSGDTVMLFEGYTEGLTIYTKKWENRGVTEPTSQTVVRGPKEGFSETLGTNISLIRRRIKNSNLWVETKKIGKVSKTDVSLMYIKGIADEKVIEEIRIRLNRIDIDGILESGNIEELIEDKTYTPFPTLYNTERPDVISAGLLEGRIAILVDGTTFVLLVPALFIHFFQSPEDYYQRYDIGFFIRILRIISFFIALLGPSIFVAFVTLHHELIPPTLLVSLAAQRERVPFPAFLEAFLMEITFEILREAGLRMPRAVGQSISIVGTLVIGQAAVEAGLVGTAMVIVVSLTAITNFLIPTFNMAISVRILRFGFLILASVFGLYGISVGLIILVMHLCSLRSFGVPYMGPYAPFILSDQKDSLIRFPMWALFSRSRLTSQENVNRQQDPKSAEPGPPKSAN